MERARIDGVELAYELRGSGAPLVMIHGAQGDQTMFAGLASACASGFRVLTFDQRGSGLSEKPDMDYSIAMLADDTAALIDHLGLSPAHVIGVSMGGMIAQELALRHPGKVRSLVLGCTTPGGPRAIHAEGNALAAACACSCCRRVRPSSTARSSAPSAPIPRSSMSFVPSILGRSPASTARPVPGSASTTLSVPIRRSVISPRSSSCAA